MNGDRTAEQYAEVASEAAQRASQKATEIADAALRMEQTASRMERGLDDLRRDLRKLQSQVAVGFANAKTTRPDHVSLTELDFEDSPTGTHKLVSKRKWDQWYREREMSVDAKRWRKVLNMSGKIALAIVLVIVGALIRHYLFGGH